MTEQSVDSRFLVIKLQTRERNVIESNDEHWFILTCLLKDLT